MAEDASGSKGLLADFPALAPAPDGTRITYLDSAATAQKPQQVIDAVSGFYERHNANINRGLYALGLEATKLYEEARADVARLLGAPPKHVIFTAGTTDALNMVAYGLADRLREGDEILLTPHEHHANIVPWQQIVLRTGARIVYCGLNDDFTIDVADLKRKMTDRTKVLAITHVSNVLGTVTPLHEIVPYAKSKGIIVVVDGAQAIPHFPVDVYALGCDAYACSAHKALGPTGIGVLYLSDKLMGMAPYRTGGDMIDDVTEQSAEFARDEPRRFEAGTPNIAGAVGFGAAARYLTTIDRGRELERELTLFRKAWDALSAIPRVTLHGPSPDAGYERVGIIEFTIDNVHPHDVAQLLGDAGVCIRSGKHCAHPLLRRMGINALNRASFYLYNTEADIDALVAAVKRAIARFDTQPKPRTEDAHIPEARR